MNILSLVCSTISTGHNTGVFGSLAHTILQKNINDNQNDRDKQTKVSENLTHYTCQKCKLICHSNLLVIGETIY